MNNRNQILEYIDVRNNPINVQDQLKFSANVLVIIHILPQKKKKIGFFFFVTVHKYFFVLSLPKQCVQI